MIGINLLDSKRAGGGGLAAARTARRVGIACGCTLVLAAGMTARRGWSLHREADRLERQLVAASERMERLRPLLDDIAWAEQERDRLASELALSDQLLDRRTTQVGLLGAVSQALPDGVWLVRLEQRGDAVTLEGKALTLDVVSDFATNLEASNGEIRPPVAIVSARVEAGEGGEVVAFELQGSVNGRRR